MRKHANKAAYVLCAAGAAGVVQVIGELFGTTWQLSTAALLVLTFTAAVTFVITGRVRDAAQQTRVVKDRVNDLRKLVEGDPGRHPRNSGNLAADLAAVRVGVEKLTESHAAIDARTAHLTQVATQLAVEMDFLLGIMRHERSLDELEKSTEASR